MINNLQHTLFGMCQHLFDPQCICLRRNLLQADGRFFFVCVCAFWAMQLETPLFSVFFSYLWGRHFAVLAYIPDLKNFSTHGCFYFCACLNSGGGGWGVMSYNEVEI